MNQSKDSIKKGANWKRSQGGQEPKLGNKQTLEKLAPQFPTLKGYGKN